MRKTIVSFLIIVLSISIHSQSQVVDRVVAIIGNHSILQSDIENQYLQLQAQKIRFEGDAKCVIFEDLLIQKLLLDQAKIDSVEVSEMQVKMHIESRINDLMNYFGDQQKMEEYYKKSIYDLKEDLHDVMQDQAITQQMREKLVKDVKMTPSEVKNFYEKLPADSIPEVSTNIEYMQICLYPSFKENSILEIRQKMLDLRKRIIEGEKFATLARLYSEDPGSARNGGEIGFLGKGELDPEYARIAFGLKEGTVSTIVESKFGYHIIQLIEKKGDKANTRHILMKPKAKPEEISAAFSKLDSIVNLIRIDSFTFERAALFFSEDENTRLNGGNVVNREDNSLKHNYSQIQPADLYAMKTLKVGEISEPYESIDEKGKQVFKIIRVKSKSEPHKANLKEDYQLLQETTIGYKRQEVFDKWLETKIKEVYIEIPSDFMNCELKNIKLPK